MGAATQDDTTPRDAAAAARPGACVVAVVMPAYQAAAFLPTTLPALKRAARGARVVVVDPGSTDGTADVAAALGAEVVRLGRRAGPAEARNEGVARVDADVVLFVDSDCVAADDVVERVHAAFAGTPSLVSLTGSYDDSPPDPGFFSQYMNLRHHHTHQRARREPASFWAGCGAVRREAFLRCGGFDAVQFPQPMIEDIELGIRLGALGTTRLDPDLQVTHLKRWTLASTVRTDVMQRALPWSRLLVARGSMPNDLNLRTSQRVAAAVAPLALLSIPALPVLAFAAPAVCAVPAAILALSLALNAPLVGFFARRRGVAFAAAGWAFHQVHLLYSAATFAWVLLTRTRTPARSAP